MQTCLIISPYFPPSTLAGVHRARHLAKYLPAWGWRPTVVCVHEAYHEQRLDPELGKLVPPSVEVVKVTAVPARLTRPFGVGEITLRARFQLKRAVLRLIKERDAKAVLITGAPFYPLMFAPQIEGQFQIPVVLDFQDPWVSAAGATQRLLSKPGLSHWLATKLEPKALQGASFITSVSETQNAQMASRYPWLDPEKMAAIPIGGDPDDFLQLRTRELGAPEGTIDETKINLSFVGTVMPRSGPLITTALRAFASLREREPRLADQMRLNFIGTSNQPNDRSKFTVLPLARAAGVADHVHEVPQRLPYLDALKILVRSNGLMLIGSDEPHYTASKIYPGLMSGTPYFSLFHKSSSSHAILLQAGGGLAFAFADAQGLEALEAPLADALAKLATAPESLGKADPSAYAPFEARSIAKQYAEIFDSVAKARPLKTSVSAELQCA